MKKTIIFFRKTLKLFVLILICMIMIISLLAFMYQPTYAIYYEGSQIGYTQDKKKMQKEFNNYVNSNNEDSKYLELKSLPEYKMTFMKKNEEIDDSEVMDIIKSEQVVFFRYYAIVENYQDKLYIDTFTNADKLINKLKENESQNADNLSIEERYEEEMVNLTSIDDAYNILYVESPKKKIEKQADEILKKNSKINTSTRILGGGAPDIGVKLIRPVEGIISSVFGHMSSMRSGAHSGLDIAASMGTPYKAAASGVVTFVGYNSAFGNMLVITHETGFQTYYCHSNKVYAKVGDVVMQGDVVGEVGSTGNSSRPHLHLEIRVNGIPYNPQYYVYN